MLRISNLRFTATAASCGGFLHPTLLNRSRMIRKTNSINPHSSEGNVGNSFEQIVEDIGMSMPFPVTDDMYDRPSNQADFHNKPEAYKTPTSGQEAANASLRGKEINTPRSPKHKYAFDKIYDPEVMRKSTASPDHYYPPPPTKQELERRRKVRQMWMVSLVALTIILVMMERILVPLKQATVMAGRT